MRFLPLTYTPHHSENRMRCEGDVASARAEFLERRPANLAFLLEKRYGWMNAYLENKTAILELGSGAGLAREFIANPHLRLSDVDHRDWIDRQVDAMNLPDPDGTLDALICSHMIHHIARPKKFFRQAARVLKPGGYLLVADVYTSTLHRALLRLMRHEGWSYEVDVFDENCVTNDPADPWSANCAIPQLLFSDVARFEHEMGGLKILRKELTECLIFPLSGGVTAKVPTIQLPRWMLTAVDRVDQALIRAFPEAFALGIRVVIQKHRDPAMRTA